MPGFSIRNAFFTIIVCLVLLAIGITSRMRMPMDFFPSINLAEVVVATLLGVLMPVGIADSNSILMVDSAHNLEQQRLPPFDAVITVCRIRLRPMLMTSLATITGMIPMALKLGTRAEHYEPMAPAIVGGLTSLVAVTIFIVPAAYLLEYGKRNRQAVTAAPTETA